MQPLFPLILIALGGTAVIVARPPLWVLGALAVHWLGMAWVLAATIPLSADWSVVAVEVITAAVCLAVLWTTEHSLQASTRDRSNTDEDTRWERQWRSHLRTTDFRASQQMPASQQRAAPNSRRAALRGQAEQLWLIVIVLATGVAGFGMARLYPVGGTEESLLAFYWAMLAGVLILVVESARSHVKMAVGLLVLLNSIALLVMTASNAPPALPILGLLAAGRIALSVVLAHSWVVLKAAFREPDMASLFNARSGPPTDALAVVPAPSYPQPTQENVRAIPYEEIISSDDDLHEGAADHLQNASDSPPDSADARPGGQPPR